jgi:hypothetical protein
MNSCLVGFRAGLPSVNLCKRGRPKQQLNPYYRQHYVEELNTTLFDDVYVSDPKLYLWRASCQQHLVLRTAQAVLKDFKRATVCRVCSSDEELRQCKHQSPSQYERLLYDMLQSQASSTHYMPTLLQQQFPAFVTEVPIVRNSSSRVDVILLDAMAQPFLLLNVDGEGHFETCHGKPATVQQEIDSRFNLAAVDQAFKLLRLHQLDIRCWNTSIKSAVKRSVMSGKDEGWVAKTPSYSVRSERTL